MFGRLPLSIYVLKCFVILFLSFVSSEVACICPAIKKNTNVDIKILMDFPYNLLQLFYYTKHPMTSSKIDLSQPPKFLSILGANDVDFDEKEETITMHFDIGEELTHSNGAYVQGGFITAMLDTSMAHLLIFKTNGEYNPLTLNINVNFLAPGIPGKFTSSATINKIGKSISFTSAELHQGDQLVATASATNKFLKL
jgi:uncharacterized protein (TIGR00369 family)